MVNAYFNIVDSFTNSLSGYIYLIPTTGPQAYQNGIVWKSANDPFPNNSTQSIIPATYDVVFGAYGKMYPDFTITLPSIIDGQTVNVNGYIVSGSIINPNYTASYAISSTFALTASYVSGQSPTSSYALTSSVTTMYPDIYDTGNVGIKQKNPQYTLDVSGTIGNIAGNLSIAAGNGSNGGTINLVAGNSGISSPTAGYINILAGNDTTHSIDGQVIIQGGLGHGNGYVLLNPYNSSYVGINNPNPQFSLDVNGPIGSSGTLTLETGTDNVVFNSADGELDINIFSSVTNFEAHGNPITLNAESGAFVGIIQNNPQFALDVLGSINLTGQLLQNSKPYTSSLATSASYSLSSSWAPLPSLVSSASYSTNALTAYTASYITASNVIGTVTSASYATKLATITIQGNGQTNITGTVNLTGSLMLSSASLSSSLSLGPNGNSFNSAVWKYRGMEMYLAPDGNPYINSGVNGIVFASPNNSWMDFAWTVPCNSTTTFSQSTVRYETRNAFTKTGAPELQFGSTTNYIGGFGYMPNMYLGGTYNASTNGLSVGQLNSPSAPPVTGLYVQGPTNLNGVATASAGIIAKTLFQLPYSSSLSVVTPVALTGSAYFEISGSNKLLFIYNGTSWSSCSLA